MHGEVRSAGQSELQPGDIIFECPQCGKSLAIDVRGAGYIVRCPECQTEIQVPGTDTGLGAAGGLSEPATPPAGESHATDALLAEIDRLKHQQALDAERNRRISAELALIQAALDRLVGMLESTPASEKD